MAIQVIPDVGFGWTTVPRETLNDTQSRIQQVQLSVCATEQPLRWGYGRMRLGALWLKPIATSSYLYLPWIIARGPIDAVESIELGNAEAPSGVSTQVYLGATSPSVDPWLLAAYGAQGHTYADTLAGIAWGVMRVAQSASSIPTDLTVTARLAKVYDPRADSSAGGSGLQRLATPSTWTWSANPALALADFLRSTEYGRGETVDWASVATVANIADQAVGSGARRGGFGLVFDTVQPVAAIEETLRAYAGCWVVREDGVARLVPDAAASSVFAFSTATGNYLADSIRIDQRKRRDLPTVVSVVWTDTSTTPWQQRTHVEYADGVLAGTTPWREESVQMPGIQDASWAKREALRRLNQYITSDLTVTLTGVGDALQLRRGDVVSVTDAEGLSAKLFRLTGHAPRELGLWSETLVEYDPAIYSDAVADAPTTADTSFPLPSNPPTLAGLAAVEQTYALETGLPASRVRVTWTAPAWPFVRAYRVTLRVGATPAAEALVGAGLTGWTTPQLQEGVTYTVEVAIVSTVDAEGPAATTLITVAGKQIPPGNVASIDGFEVGGRVFLTWPRADNPTNPGTADPDVWRYEVRRDATSASWGDATNVVVNATDSLRLVDEGAPAGTWKYMVKAIDSVGQYSATAATKTITVTTDAAAFLVDSYDQTSPTLTNMTEFRLAPTDSNRYWVTEDGTVFGTAFSSNLSTYANALATYHSSVTSTWLGESEDFGSLLGGQWTGTATVSALSGSLTSYFGHSTDGSAWTYASGLSQKVNARFARMKHEATTTSTLLVTAPTQQIRLDAIPRDEVGTGTSSASGATTVTLSNAYIAVKKLTITPEGSTARMGLYDNVVVGSPTTFDVYVFNDSGTKIASAFRYAFQGV